MTEQERSPELVAVSDYYLASGDFNGLDVRGPLPADWDLDRLCREVDAGLIQAVTGEDYLNPHIRPWQSRRSSAAQVADVRKAVAGSGHCCLYPTPLGMRDVPLPEFVGRPFAEAMARGFGSLELAFFDTAGIESYRNDPRYHFSPNDFGFSFGVGDQAYLDASEPEDDKIRTIEAGYAFDLSKFEQEGNDLARLVCMFYIDLSRLTPTHQQRLKTWQKTDADYQPHPTWWGMQMGHWPEYIGPFDKILGEMVAINEIWELAWDQPLFVTTERPREWGWLLRPATNDWAEFIHTTDKLLSDNLSHAALDAAGAPTLDAAGARIGTLRRLETWLNTKTSAKAGPIRETLAPIRKVRRDRQGPAHTISPPLTDRAVVRQQREVLAEIASSLEAIRRLLATHPAAKRSGWEAEEWLDDWLIL